MGIIPRRHPSLPRGYCGDLSAPLVDFGGTAWTVGNACEGALILGATGSGKSSGAGAHIARAFLRSGMGGLILCAKPDECARFQAYARECGRSHSVIVMDGSCRERFNFLDYALLRDGSGAGQTLNLVTLFVQLADAAQRRGGGGNGGDPFWRDAMKEMLSHTFDALIAAYGRVRLHDVQRFLESLPTGEDRRQTGFCYQTMRQAYEAPARPLSAHDWSVIDGYVFQHLRTLSDRTRGGIIASFTSLAHSFIKGAMHELFCTSSTIVPELTHEGALLILDLPVKDWDTSGILAAHVMKYLWQKAAERRVCGPQSRPVFLWADECQNFLSEYDNEFQSTARSAKACAVYLTQNLSGIYATIGGRSPEHAANALLSNLRTKVFHANEDRLTNQWAADLIGKDIQLRRNWSHSSGTNASKGRNSGYSSGTSLSFSTDAQGNRSSSSGHNSGFSSGTSSSTGWSETSGGGENETIDYRVQPSFFSERLRTGGKRNGYMTDAVIFQPGQTFAATGGNYTLCAFPQS